MHTHATVFALCLLGLLAACGGEEPTPPGHTQVDAAATDAVDAVDATVAIDAMETVDGAMTVDAATTLDGAMTDGAESDARTTARTWTAPVLVAEPAGAPTMAMDPAGNVTAAWFRHFPDPLRETLAVSRFSSATGWSAPLTLSANNMRSGDQALGADANGNVIAVWSENDGNRTPQGAPMQDVWTRRFEPATGWTAATKLDTSDVLPAIETAIAVAPSGQAIALVTYRNSNSFDLWARRHVPGVGWEAPTQLTAPSKTAAYAAVAIGAAGDAMVVWRQQDSTDVREGIWARRFTPAGGWAPAVQLAPPASGGDGQPAVAVDASGNAIALWVRDEESSGSGATKSIWARSYTAAGWSEAMRLDEGTVQGHLREGPPRVAFDGAGNAIAIWSERVATVDGVPRYAVQTRRWRNGSWGAISELGRSPNYYLRLQLAVNAAGDAIVAWEREQNERSRSGARTFTMAAGWAEEVRLAGGADDDLEVVTPQVAITPSGDAFAMWLEHGYEGPSPPRIWSAAYR